MHGPSQARLTPIRALAYASAALVLVCIASIDARQADSTADPAGVLAPQQWSASIARLTALWRGSRVSRPPTGRSAHTTSVSEQANVRGLGRRA